MKNHGDPSGRIGRSRLKQIRKHAHVSRASSNGFTDSSTHAVALLEEARTWLKQFYSETVGISSGSSNAFNSRWAEAQRQIRDGQPDYLTREELEYGAKVAWRNSTRCVGRLVWESLVVRDLRHLDTPEEVFAGLVDHIELSTNKGQVLPMVSVFASGLTERPKVRIWNRQLIGYAGYLQSDGSIVGDPLNLQFTQRIEALGWKRPQPGRFNVLPIVIEMDGAIHWYNLPAGVVLEVPIRHPRYDWFADLGLK